MRIECTITDKKELVRIVRKQALAIGEKFDQADREELKDGIEYYLDHGGLPIWKVIVGLTRPVNITGKWRELPDINLKEDWCRNQEGEWELEETSFRDGVQVAAFVSGFPHFGPIIWSAGGGWEIHTSVIRGDTIPPEGVNVYEL